MLRTGGIDLADPEFIAQSGWTTDELEHAIAEEPPHGPYALVTLLIGVNNQYRGRTVIEFRDHLRALLAHATHAAGHEAAHVIVVSIPDWGVTPFNVSRDASQVATAIDAFNAAAEDEAARAGASWVDITDLGRAEPTAVVEDGLHPNAVMYARWAERLAGVADAILGQR